MTFLGWIEMRCDDEAEPTIGRHRAEQLLERLQPTRRRPDSDDGKFSHGPFPDPLRAHHQLRIAGHVPSPPSELEGGDSNAQPSLSDHACARSRDLFVWRRKIG